MQHQALLSLRMRVGQAMVWLIFLANPLNALLSGDYSLGEKGTGIITTIIFAAAYTAAFFFRPGTFSIQVAGLGGILVAGAIVMYLVMGPMSATYHVYLVAYCAFVLPAPYRLILGLLSSLVCAAMSFLLGAPWVWPGCIAVLAIGIFVTDAMEQLRLAARIEKENLVVSERNRMAMDVHDLIGHSLTVVKLKTQLASKLIAADPDRARAELAEVQGIIATALGGIRQTVTESRVLSLSEELASAVETLQATGLTTRVLGDSDEPTGPIRMALGWVIREATTNILRHAHASTCEFSFARSAVSISDDGNGPPKQEGNGLRGMRERIAAAGGSLSIGRSVLGGTRIEVSW